MIRTRATAPWLLALALPVLLAGTPGRAQPPAAVPATGGADTGAREADRADRCPPGLEVLLPRPLARETDLGAGDSVTVRPEPTAGACRARVAGVYVPRADPARLAVRRPRVLFHLPQLARLVGREGEADRFSVDLRDGADPAGAADRLASLLPGARVLPSREVARASSTTFEVVRRFHRAIAAITLAAGGVFLACIMVLKVEERRASAAALRLLGVSRTTLVGWLAAETALVAVLGGALGLGIGAAAVRVVNRVYQALYDTELVFALLTAESVGLTLAAAGVLGLGAGLAAGARLLRLDPLDEVGR